MRTGGVFFFLIFFAISAQGFTVILQNGKTLEGELLAETPDAIKFRDLYGVEYTLKKEILNIPAMLNKNPETRPLPPRQEVRHQETTLQTSSKPTLAEIARENKKNRTGKAPVLRNRPNPAMPVWPKTSPDLETWIARTERELQRLSGQCRAAGGSPSAKRTLQTNTYTVGGRSIVVSGYWADPEEIEAARRICTQALLTEKAIDLARADLMRMQTLSGASSGTR